MNYKIGIYDDDIDYAIAFMEYTNSLDDNIRVSVFSSEDAVLEYLSENKPDILLLHETSEIKIKDLCVIRLTEERQKADNCECIFKYQNIDNIIATLHSYISRKIQKKKNETGVYAVYSPIGRCGKTVLSKALCLSLDKSIYIGFPAYLEEEKVCEENERFVYYMKAHSEEILSVIRELPREAGSFICMSGTRSYQDYTPITREDVGWLKAVLLKQGEIDNIVIDLDALTCEDFTVFKEADRIFIPYLTDEASTNKLKHFKEIISKALDDKSIEKLKYVIVPNVSYTNQLVKEVIERSDLY